MGANMGSVETRPERGTEMNHWQVIDPKDDEVLFDADTIANAAVVRGCLFTRRAWAKKLARENSDPMADEPLRAVVSA